MISASDPKRTLVFTVFLKRFQTISKTELPLAYVMLVHLLLALVGCADRATPTEWPADSLEIKENFVAEQRTFSDLKAEMNRLSYSIVYLDYNGQPNAAAIKGGEPSWEIPAEANDWSTNMTRIDVQTAHLDENSFHLIGSPRETDKSTLQMTFYLQGSDVSLRRCSDSFRSIGCGVCERFSLDGWVVGLVWASLDLDADIGELNECYAEGFRELGYDENVLGLIQ